MSFRSNANYLKILFTFLGLCGFLLILYCYVVTVGNSFILNDRKDAISVSSKIFSNNSSELWKLNKLIYLSDNIDLKHLGRINLNISYQGYKDKNFVKDCGIPNNHHELFDLMKFWINFTATHNIPWWLIYGSLIGSMRHKDMVPWDSDIDLGIPSEYEPLIRNMSTKRTNISNKQVNIITRPGEHCPYNGPREDCQGRSVTSHVDGCAFCGPLARIFYYSWKRIDIYLYEVIKDKKRWEIIDEGIFEYTNKPPRFPFDWHFPLKKCSFMGLIVMCPNKSETILTNYYKTYESLYECIKGNWKAKKKI